MALPDQMGLAIKENKYTEIKINITGCIIRAQIAESASHKSMA